MADRPSDERRRTGRGRWRLPPVVPGITSALEEDDDLVAWPQHGSLAAQNRRRKAILPDQPPRRRPTHATVELDVADIPVDGRIISILVWPERRRVVRGRLPLHAHEMRASGPTSATAGSLRYPQRRAARGPGFPQKFPHGVLRNADFPRFPPVPVRTSGHA